MIDEHADRERDEVQLRNLGNLRKRVALARERIGDDPPTLQLLTLYELGVTRKREVLAFGMTPQAYRRSRDRLHLLFGAEILDLDTVEFGPPVPVHRDGKSEHLAEHDVFRSMEAGAATIAVSSSRPDDTPRAEYGLDHGTEGAPGPRIAAGYKR